MKLKSYASVLICVMLVMACSPTSQEPQHAQDHDDATGPHGGKLLFKDGFALEITIAEHGTPPEYRIWPSHNNVPLEPSLVGLKIVLERLGNRRDEIGFAPAQGFLRGDAVVSEPHSFVVNVEASFASESYSWRYESFEGRTHIAPALLTAAEIETETAGPATIRDTLTVYGRIAPNPERVSHIHARFSGVIQAVNASIGDVVSKGKQLATVEADDSLNSYPITSPISGTVVERHANPGETTGGRSLFTVIDTRTVWADLGIFPSDRTRVTVGAPVTLKSVIGGLEAHGKIAMLNPIAEENQSVTARVLIDNSDGLFAAGMFLSASIEVAQYEVPLAVKRTGLQTFRDFTVVFAQVDNTFEVRMLDLGRQDAVWAEVRGGLMPGTQYVTGNSYLIKADIEKSGASHDH
jgi:cobalt-zinc-cadmium efflux system membrane fusion protein